MTKLFKNKYIKIVYKTNKNKLQILNSSHNKDNTTTNSIYTVSYTHLDVYKRQDQV